MLTKQNLFGQQNQDRLRRDLRPGIPPTSGTAATPATAPEPTSTEPTKSEDAVSATIESKGSKLIVGPDIKLKGAEITDCDTLVVEGRVEASMDSRVIQIAEHGAFHGTVGIDVAEIRGRFEGELTARKQLVIYATGRVSGKIRYGSIVIEQGGELSGDIGTTSSGARPTSLPRPAETAVNQ